jgi:hypothetical protein
MKKAHAKSCSKKKTCKLTTTIRLQTSMAVMVVAGGTGKQKPGFLFRGSDGSSEQIGDWPEI